MAIKTPNTIVKYHVDEQNSGFYLFVRDKFNIYRLTEAFNLSDHGQLPNYYVLDGNIPSGLTITGTGNTYLVRSTLTENVIINDAGTPTVIGNSGSSATVTVNGVANDFSSTETDTAFDFNFSLATFNIDVDALTLGSPFVIGTIPTIAVIGGAGNATTYKISALSDHVDSFSIDSESGTIIYHGTGLDIAAKVSFNLTVIVTNGDNPDKEGHVAITVTPDFAPFLDDPKIIVNGGFNDKVTLTTRHLNYTDVDSNTADDGIIYSIKGLATGATVIKIDTDNDTETVLAVGDEFTQADVIAGKIVLDIDESQSLAGFALSVRNTSEYPSSIHDFAILTRVDLTIDDVGGANTLDYSNFPNHNYQILAGNGRDTITSSGGDDYIIGGRGDDRIILNSGTDSDEIVYEYDAQNKIATDGGDVITGFKRGEDKFTLKTKTYSDTLEEVLTAADGTDTDSFTDNEFIITPDLKFTGGTATVTGITLVFRENQTSSSGRMSDNSVQISFDKALTWDEFLDAIKIVDGDDVDANFDYNHLAVKSAVVLPTLLGEGSSGLIADALPTIAFENATTSIDEGDNIPDTTVATLGIADDLGLGYIYSYDIDNKTDFKLVGGNDLVFIGGSYNADGNNPATSFTVTVTATADNTEAEAVPPRTFTFTINDINDENPTLTVPSSVDIPENSPNNTALLTAQATPDVAGTEIAYSIVGVNGTNASLFAIDSAGNLTAKSGFDYEADPRTYTLTIKATAGEKFAEQEVTINVTNVNDIAPSLNEISSGPYNIAENILENPAYEILSFTVADADTDVLTFTKDNFTISGTGSEKFTIVATGGNTYKLSPVDGADFTVAGLSVDYNLKIKASDGTNANADDDDFKVTVSVLAVDDDAPVMTPDPENLSSFSINENISVQTNIGFAFSVSDVDTALSTFSKDSFTISGVGSEKFDIIAAAGDNNYKLVALAGQDFDVDADGTLSEYVLKIKAFDGTNSTAGAGDLDVTVSVADIDDNASEFGTGGIAGEVIHLSGGANPTGTLEVNDVDIDDDNRKLDITLPSDAVLNTDGTYSVLGKYGTIIFSGDGNRSWEYILDATNPNTIAIPATGDGSTVSDEVFTVTLASGGSQNITLSQDITISVTGAVDDPDLSASGNDYSNVALSLTSDKVTSPGITSWYIEGTDDTPSIDDTPNIYDDKIGTSADRDNDNVGASSYSYLTRHGDGKSITFDFSDSDSSLDKEYFSGRFILHNRIGADGDRIDGATVQFMNGGDAVGDPLTLYQSDEQNFTYNETTYSNAIIVALPDQSAVFDKVVLTFYDDDATTDETQNFSEVQIFGYDNATVDPLIETTSSAQIDTGYRFKFAPGDNTTTIDSNSFRVTDTDDDADPDNNVENNKFDIINAGSQSAPDYQLVALPASAFDFETQSTYNLTVQLLDSGNNVFVSAAPVEVKIIDVAEATAINGQSTPVFSNSDLDADSSTPATPDNPVTANNPISGTFSVVDIDNPDSVFYNGLTEDHATIDSPYGTLSLDAVANTWTYTLDSTKDATIALATGVPKTDSFIITIGEATATFNIKVSGANDAPTITPGNSNTFNFMESHGAADTTIKTPVGYAFTAIDDNLDPDPGNNNNALPVSLNNFKVLAGSTGDTESDLFRVAAGNNSNSVADFKIVTKVAANFDYETTASYDIRIVLTDAVDNTLVSTESVTINLIDLNDKPSVIADTGLSGDVEIDVDTDDTTASDTGTLSVSDSDGTAANRYLTITPDFTIHTDIDSTADYDSGFTLVGTYGDITFSGDNNWEWEYTLDLDRAATRALAAADTDIKDTFTVIVDDGSEANTSKEIEINVTGSDNDRPILSLVASGVETNIANYATHFTNTNSDKTQTLFDGIISTDEDDTVPYLVSGAIDEIIRLDFGTATYTGGDFVLHNLVSDDDSLEQRIDGSTVQFKLDNALVASGTLQSSEQLGNSNAITISAVDSDGNDVKFDEIILTFTGSTQSFSEIEVLSSVFALDYATVAGDANDTVFSFTLTDEVAASYVSSDFAITGTGSDNFEIVKNTNTGNFDVKVAATADLLADFDANAAAYQYDLTIIATDKGDSTLKSAPINAVITIVDIDEAPSFGGKISGAITRGDEDPITGKLKLTDPDAWAENIATSVESAVYVEPLPGDTKLYGSLTLTGDDNLTWVYTFDPDNSQTLAFGETVDEVFTVTSSLTAGGITTQTTQDITITVSGEDTPPELTAFAPSSENQASKATITAPDIGQWYIDFLGVPNTFPSWGNAALILVTNGIKTRNDSSQLYIPLDANKDDNEGRMIFDFGDTTYTNGIFKFYNGDVTTDEGAEYVDETNIDGSTLTFYNDDDAVFTDTLNSSAQDSDGVITFNLDSETPFDKVVLTFNGNVQSFAEIEIFGSADYAEVVDGTALTYIIEENFTEKKEFELIFDVADEDNDSETNPITADSFTITDKDGSTDGDKFDIEYNTTLEKYQLFAKAGQVFDFEEKSKYNLEIKVADSNGSDSNIYDVTIDLINFFEIPSGPAGKALDEDVPIGTGIADAVYTATADRPVTWAFKTVADDDAGLFFIDPASGTVTFKTATTPDYETKTSYIFTVVATSIADNSLTAEQEVKVAVLDEFSITSGDTAPALAENIEVGAGNVNAVYTAEADSNDVKWSFKPVAGDDADKFYINPTSGKVSFVTATTPDYETQSSYSFTIMATGPHDILTADKKVTIEVTNALEVTSGAAGIAVPENKKIEIGHVVYNASSDSSVSGTWSLIGDDANLFTINDPSSGTVTFNVSVTPDDNTKPAYNFTTVFTTQGGSASAHQDVTVSVIDGLDITSRPTGGLKAGDAFAAGDKIYTATSDTADTTWSLADDDTDFSIDGNTGVVSFVAQTTTPTAGATYSFTVTATTSGETTSQNVTLTSIASPFSIPDNVQKKGDGSGDDILNNYSTVPTLYQGGDGDDEITYSGNREYVIVPGLGSDTVNDAGGDAIIIQRFNNASDYNVYDEGLRLYDGSLNISNFNRGDDKLYLVDISRDNPNTDFSSFITDFKEGISSVTITYDQKGNNDVNSVTINFAHAGRNAGDTADTGNSITITFSSSTIIQPYTEVADNFTDNVLKPANYDFLDDLLGTDSFHIIDGDTLDASGLEIL